MTIERVIVRSSARTGLSESAVRNFIESMPASLVADPETVALLHGVKAAGHALYCLSNMPKESIDYLERAYSFWPLFSGMVISSRVGFCKPEREIFAHLLTVHRLQASETIFIDDTSDNVVAAQSLGMRGFTSDHRRNAEPSWSSSTASRRRGLGCRGAMVHQDPPRH